MIYELENAVHTNCDNGSCQQCNSEIFTELLGNNDIDLFEHYGLEV